MSDVRDWFEANGGIKNKTTRELVWMLESDTLRGTGYVLKIKRRGRIVLAEADFIKEWRRTVRHSKEVKRKRNVR